VRAREIAREVDFRDLSAEDVRTLTRKVFETPDPRPSDLMLVFGAARSTGRWQPVASLLRAGLAGRVLIAGGTAYEPGSAVCEAEGIRADLIGYGVDPGMILVEARSRNTLENVVFARDMLACEGTSPKAILFYCKSHHSGRARRTLALNMAGVTLSCATYDASYEGVTVRAADWHQTRIGTRRVLAEYERIRRYSARGDIA
jgi:hypothetical protein